MTFLFCIALLISAVHSYTPAPRWGQATSLISSYLYIQGGKQNPDGSQTYNSAPAEEDLLYLPLDKPFSVESPPWELISSTGNFSQSQGPAVAWHTLSAYNSSMLLLFGGLPSPASLALMTQNDSACLLNVFNREIPQFIDESLGWANEPMRRIHHAAVSAITGEVYIFGGEKADGSFTYFSDHWVFNPNDDTFTLLPTDDKAPPALTGHAAIILPNGQIYIFGGLASTGLLPFDTIWIFDTSTYTWSTISCISPPPGRRGFAYVLLDDNAILIHGGCDGVCQNTYGDGWIYNITTTTWTQIPALDDLGARKDHFAVSYGGQVIFGFGYGKDGPANATLCVFNPTSTAWQPTFTPPPPTNTVSPTIPVASATDTGIAGSHTPSLTGSVHPTTTGGGNGGGNNNNGGGGDGGDGSNGGDGGGPNGQKPQSATGKTTAIAVGTVLGVCALVAAGLGAFWYMRKQQQRRWAEGGVGGVFSPLQDEEGGAGGAPSAAKMFDAPPAEKGLVGGAVETVGATLGSWGTWAAAALGIGGAVGAGAAAATERRRRDMLADEDAHDFGWYDDGDGHSSRLGRFRQGSGGSSWSLMSVFRPKPRREGSAASGMSFASRGGSLLGHADPLEKDPFRDDTYLRDAAAAGGAGVLGAAARPRGHRQPSYASVNSVNSNYVDPFADPISEQDLAGPGALLMNTGHGYSRAGPLSPVTEISRSSASQSGSSNDHHAALSPFSTVSRSSFGFTSNSHHASPALPHGASPAVSPGPSTLSAGAAARPSSILDMKPPPSDQPIRRSDTWWARFASKSLLDRRSSRGSGTNVAPPDIRDPNPLPQRLGFVKEETSSVLRERSDGSDISARAGPVYGRSAAHGKSMSSIQTQQTADSAAIERMGGNVDVMLRGNRQSGSTSTRGSTTTHGGSVGGSLNEGHTQRRSWQPAGNGEEELYTSPVEMVPAAAFGLPTSPCPPREPSPPPAPSVSRPALSTASSSGSSASSGVADRIKAYERRMSQDVSPPPPTNTKQREEWPRKKTHGANYGLVARPSLFVANPDHGAGEGSGDTA
ncbi:hypothetical protein B0H19DRAFT_1273199 [Mycena capillaripes]|nr:hypothetical protein B0H19DRAFT_1273199 [Mycena capillaripes]